jgi:hypothetical protein
VWRSSGASRKHTPDCIHPHFGQVSKYSLEIPAINEGWNVFQQRILWSYDAQTFSGRWPHVSGIVGSEHGAGGTEWLAGETACNHVDKSSALFSGTGLDEVTNVAKDGRSAKQAVVNSCPENSLTIFIPFDIT